MSNLAYVDNSKNWTYKDVQELDDDNRYEVINGILYLVSSPTITHQDISGEIYNQIKNYLRGKTCKVYISALDVFFDNKIDTSSNYVQPDVFVVCDNSKRRQRGILGSPDFIVEILSPSTRGKDKKEKFNLYLQNKVKEYWIVDIKGESITVYLLEGNKYISAGEYDITEDVKVNIFDDLFINIKEVVNENRLMLYEDSAVYGVHIEDDENKKEV